MYLIDMTWQDNLIYLWLSSRMLLSTVLSERSCVPNINMTWLTMLKSMVTIFETHIVFIQT